MSESDNVLDIQQRLAHEIAVILDVESSGIHADTLLTSLGMDSIRFVEILVLIERAFGVRLIESGLTREDLRDVASLAEAVVRARRNMP